MYETFSHFLTSFSAQYPFFWALLVMACIAAAGLLLFEFWEWTLRGIAPILSVRRLGIRRRGIGRRRRLSRNRPGTGRAGH